MIDWPKADYQIQKWHEEYQEILRNTANICRAEFALTVKEVIFNQTLSDVHCLVTKSFIPMSPRLWVEILLSSKLINFLFSVFLTILSISQVADTNTTRNVHKQDRSIILVKLFLWKCNKVNEGQRVTFLVSLLNVLYFWTPWARMKRRGRFL